jgi:hypothetical protein
VQGRVAEGVGRVGFGGGAGEGGGRVGVRVGEDGGDALVDAEVRGGFAAAGADEGEVFEGVG